MKKDKKRFKEQSGIKFQFCGPNSIDADIRISFIPGNSHSAVGTDSTKEMNRPSMNLGWIDRYENDDDGTIKHEFGHALGLQHEHQHPNAVLNWDKKKVYEYMKKSMNWSKETVDANIFSQVEYSMLTLYDKNSIMHYYYEDEFFNTPPRLSKNTKISEGDIIAVKSFYFSEKLTQQERLLENTKNLRPLAEETVELSKIIRQLSKKIDKIDAETQQGTYFHNQLATQTGVLQTSMDDIVAVVRDIQGRLLHINSDPFESVALDTQETVKEEETFKGKKRTPRNPFHSFKKKK